MKKLLMALVFGLLTLVSADVALAQQGVRSHRFTIAGPDSAINLINTGIAYHKLIWNVSGTASACTVALDTSSDGTTWSAGGAIPGQSCTSNGTSTVVNVVANYVRINMTALTVTAGSSVTVTWDGYTSAPSGGGTVTSITGTSPIVATPNPITGTGDISCPTCNTSSATIGGSIAASQVAFGTGVNTIGGNANYTYNPTGTSSEASASGADDTLIKSDFSTPGSPLVQLRARTNPTGSIAAPTGTVGASASSGTFSATATGDLKIVAVTRAAAGCATLPAGWTQIGTCNDTAASFSVIYACNKSSSAGDTGTGTWTNGVRIIGASYSGTGVGTTGDCNTTGVGAKNQNFATASTTANYAAITLTVLDGSSWVVAFGADATVAITCPAGLPQRRAIGTSQVFCDSNAGTTTWAGATVAVSSSTWTTAVMEILSAPTGVSSMQVNAAHNLVEFGYGGTNLATAIDARDKGVGLPLGSVGTYRLSKAGTIVWRNNADSGNMSLGLNASDNLLFNGSMYLGVDNSTNGTFIAANGGANAHTVWGSGATTTNTILGFATVPVTGHLVICNVSATTCTLADGGVPATGTLTASGLSLPVNQLMLGNTYPDTKPLGSLGTTTTVLHGNAAGAPSFAAVVGADMTNNTVTATQLAAQYSKWEACGSRGIGDGLNAIAAGTYLQFACVNDTGVTVTITGIRCWTDNAGTSTLNAANNAATALLTGAVTCNATKASGGAAGTQSGTTTLANGDAISFTFVADGTSKQTNWTVSGTY